MIKNPLKEMSRSIGLLIEGETDASLTIMEGDYPVVVDQREDVSSLIKRGRYDRKSHIFSKVVLPEGTHGISAATIRQARIEQDTSTERVCDLLTMAYYTPATIHQFLALGATYQALQMVHPIASIGYPLVSKDGYYRFVLTLESEKGKKFLTYEKKGKRILGLESLEGVWPKGTIFAVVKI